MVAGFTLLCGSPMKYTKLNCHNIEYTNIDAHYLDMIEKCYLSHRLLDDVIDTTQDSIFWNNIIF